MGQLSDRPREDDETGGEGEKGSGGGPTLKPDQSLFDPSAALADGSDARSEGSRPVEHRGEWEFYPDGIMLYHRARKKRLMLEQLNTPTKMMKVIVALGSQPGWDADNLIKALDRAAQERFKKSLYQVISLSHDSASLDWRSGAIRPEAERPKPSSL